MDEQDTGRVWTDQEKLSRITRVLEATNAAVKDLHAKLDAAAERNAVLELQLAASEQNLQQQKRIVADHLAQTKNESEGLVLEIQRLKKLLREAGIVDKY